MNQFCEIKGIKREFSVARTPQQNRVAERKNRTLIEVARTMLVDSKLPTTFWAEAVNTACLEPTYGNPGTKDHMLPRKGIQEVDENKHLTTWGRDDEQQRSESERLNQREMQNENTNSTNGVNTVSTPVSTARPTVDTTVPSPPVNTARPSVNTANAFEEHPNLKGYLPYNNAFSYPPFPKYIFNGIT
ncbi:ribonuclease H-like domain-containing protein [Tanacetum coccineum]|uniref:Ribonuclease H-like domain-containing protein n=1 Tax=Tanacetum coccineum TaxID=301880 RepID=A0ABQ5EZN4_9ASTR